MSLVIEGELFTIDVLLNTLFREGNESNEKKL